MLLSKEILMKKLTTLTFLIVTSLLTNCGSKKEDDGLLQTFFLLELLKPKSSGNCILVAGNGRSEQETVTFNGSSTNVNPNTFLGVSGATTYAFVKAPGLNQGDRIRLTRLETQPGISANAFDGIDCSVHDSANKTASTSISRDPVSGATQVTYTITINARGDYYFLISSSTNQAVTISRL
jgi:hypothetical protein